MYEPDDAVVAGFLDRVTPADDIERAIEETVCALRGVHLPSHASAKQRLRGPTMAAMRKAIDAELTPDAYRARAASLTAVALSGG